MDILIIGRGAVAITLAARLANAKFNVVVADQYGTDGIIDVFTCSSFDACVGGKVKYVPLAGLQLQRFEFVIICTKLYQLESALSDLNRMGGASKPKVFVQNGFVEELVEFGENDYLAIIDMACRLINPRRSYTSIFHTIHFHRNSPFSIIDSFRATGFEIITHEDLLYSRLRKFIFACSSAWMAVHNLSIEESFFSELPHDGLRLMIEESINILSKYAHSKGADGVAADLAGLRISRDVGVSAPRGRTDELLSFTSLYQDLDRRNGKTEIDFLNGKICSLAKQLGTDAKCNKFLCRAVKLAEQAQLTPVQLNKRLHRLLIKEA